MNKVIYIVLIAVLCSCKSNSVAQEKVKTSSDKPKIEKPKFGDPSDNELTKLKPIPHSQISPNTVHLTGTVLGVNKNKSICGNFYEVTIIIKVKNITGSGSGIVNMISSQQEMPLGLIKNRLKNFEEFDKKTIIKKHVNLVVKETLCRNTTKTAYEIVSMNFIE